jgi:hypothetical protein
VGEVVAAMDTAMRLLVSGGELAWMRGLSVGEVSRQAPTFGKSRVQKFWQRSTPDPDTQPLPHSRQNGQHIAETQAD